MKGYFGVDQMLSELTTVQEKKDCPEHVAGEVGFPWVQIFGRRGGGKGEG